MATSLKKPHVAVEEAGQDSDEDDFSVSGESEEGGSDDEGVEGMQEASGQSDGDEAEDEEEDEEQNEDEAANPNAGWAEAMAKILRKKTQENKPSILLKNKQLDKQKESRTKEQQEKKKQADKRKAWEMMCRVKPDVVQDKEKERNLQRTATRGVVQLFNAVRNHQKKVGEKIKEVGDSERKKAKVMSAVTKKDFIDILRGAAGMNTSTIKTEQQPEVKEEKPAWSVLRDDFMMGAAMKDWDKESDRDERNEEARPADGDSDTD